MGDLNREQALQPVSIYGTDATGLPTNPVNADVNLNLKVIDFATAATGSAVPTNASFAAGINPSGNLQGISVDATGNQYVNLKDGIGNAITSASNGVAAQRLLGVQTPDTTSASTALAALNATVSIAMAGLASAGFQISAGTFVGTLTPECSIDGGTTWAQASFYDPSNSTISTSVSFATANTTKILSILPVGGSSNIRVRVSAFTSGTANALIRASQVTGAAGAVTAAAFGNVTNSYISLTVNTTTQLLAANSNRKYAYISNNSGGTIAIQFGSATGLTSSARGLVIPNGEYYELKGDNLYTGAVFAYTNASGLVIAVTEGTP